MSERPRRASDGGGVGGGEGYSNARGGGGRRDGYGEGPGARRPQSQAMGTPVPTTNGDDLAAAAAAGLVEATPLFPASNDSTLQQREQQQRRRRQDQYQQPAAEHTSSSKGNGDHYAPAAAAEGGGGLSLPSSRLRHRPEPHGLSRTAAAGASGVRDGYQHQSVATPPREREDAAPRWGDSGDHGGANGTAKSSAYSGPPPAAAAAEGRPDSNSPERVAAPGFDRRRRENCSGNGGLVGGVGGMATGEVDGWEAPSTATAYKSNSRHDDTAFLSTPDSRGERVNASGGGGGGRGVNGYDETRNGLSSPSRAPRKQSAHSGGGRSTGARAAAAAAEAAMVADEGVRREPRGAEATAASAGAAPAGVGQIISLDR